MQLFGLIDCNNFFASCERVFNPKLQDKPVCVLSSNDGCIVARSEEVKALGVPMGAPYFKWKKMLEMSGVAIFSSNFSLYGDMSARVMDIIRRSAPGVEVYSIDEAFFSFEGELKEAVALAFKLREGIRRWTGIPVSVGIGETKTLAKAANHIAKKEKEHGGMFVITDKNRSSGLYRLPVGEVWGIGRQYAKLLLGVGAKSAYDFSKLPEKWVQASMGTSGVKTWRELWGFREFRASEHPDQRKSVISSRSFGNPVTEKSDLLEAISSYLALASETLREEDLVAARLTIYVATNRFDKEVYYGNSKTIDLPRPTSYTPELLQFAEIALDSVFKPGCFYKKAGVILTEIMRGDEVSRGLFDSKAELDKKERLMQVVDKANQEWGRGGLRLLAEGITKPWQMRQELKSPHYTTDWSQLLTIKL